MRFSNFEVVFLKKSSLDATFKSVGDVNNVYALQTRLDLYNSKLALASSPVLF
jgi:hypothetical protein